MLKFFVDKLKSSKYEDYYVTDGIKNLKVHIDSACYDDIMNVNKIGVLDKSLIEVKDTECKCYNFMQGFIDEA